MEACLAVLEGRAGRPDEAVPVYRPAISDLWRVPDALAWIPATLDRYPDGGELALFLPSIPADDAQHSLKARASVASALTAGLELAKEGNVSLTH